MQESSFGRLVGVLISPGKTFEAIAARPTWVVAMVVLVIVGVSVGTLMSGKIDYEDVIRQSLEQQNRQLGENVVLILQTVKEMTQPEIMQLLSSTANVMREEDIPEDVSMMYLMRQMRDPAVKRGLAKTLNGLRTVSEN